MVPDALYCRVQFNVYPLCVQHTTTTSVVCFEARMVSFLFFSSISFFSTFLFPFFPLCSVFFFVFFFFAGRRIKNAASFFFSMGGAYQFLRAQLLVFSCAHTLHISVTAHTRAVHTCSAHVQCIRAVHTCSAYVQCIRAVHTCSAYVQCTRAVHTCYVFETEKKSETDVNNCGVRAANARQFRRISRVLLSQSVLLLIKLIVIVVPQFQLLLLLRLLMQN